MGVYTVATWIEKHALMGVYTVATWIEKRELMALAWLHKAIYNICLTGFNEHS